jgi:hypothetical protein
MLRDKLRRLYGLDRKAMTAGLAGFSAVIVEGYPWHWAIYSGISTWSVIRLVRNGPRKLVGDDDTVA